MYRPAKATLACGVGSVCAAPYIAARVAGPAPFAVPPGIIQPMSDNLYAPPKARIADVPLPPIGRPRAVRIAATLLWISFVIGFPSLYLTTMRDPDPVGLGFFLVVAVLVTLTAVLNVFIYRGRNWARIGALVLALLDLAMSFVDDPNPVRAGALEQALSVLDLLLTWSAIALVFLRPGALWFRRRL